MHPTCIPNKISRDCFSYSFKHKFIDLLATCVISAGEYFLTDHSEKVYPTMPQPDLQPDLSAGGERGLRGRGGRQPLLGGDHQVHAPRHKRIQAGLADTGRHKYRMTILA